ncbi:hypothetical protein C6500_16100 [Candidatus Poribacteria bacterium]|nr:MAG: hypothetical protein C6500_16100 [Candidatus Poribacteria bacterium]
MSNPRAPVLNPDLSGRSAMYMIHQFNKPMNQLPDAVKNQSLFSNYYLDSLIIEQPQWADTPNIESDYAAIKELFDAIAPNAEYLNEPQTEEQFIRPLLRKLGHVFEVQPSLQTSQGTKRPDYAFFASGHIHDAAQPHINTNQFFNTALAVGDAKKWSRNLDRKTQGGGDPFNNQNPSYQIDFYLRGADKDWGILTNGRQWRLYHRQTSYRLDSFYEVDLAALLSENGDLYSFRYFYNLFRGDAFISDPTGTTFLDLVLGESQQYTVGVSDDLKNRVYDALRLLIGGFLDFPRNGFDRTNPPLDEIQTNSLILLYRILFILYAESRDLLPLDNRNYAMQYSLDHLATDSHETLDSGTAFAPGANLYWTRLRQLFTLINDGWEDHIPQYNGGLFNPGQHPFLERYVIGDDILAQVIELLTRTERGERITYRDLDVRHLGDIYEGLLEYQPRIADQDLVIVSKRGSEKVEPKSSPDQEVAYQEGEVYLLTDNDERKATGSYYTPDYIVRYIVENTLAPLCEGKSVDEILSLKILDPATGSGHFLVGVVDYLAEELITHPDAPHLTETGGEETELAYWRRRVVESCVYGVDLNPMAVELAKLSLWLHTVAKGEPLSFLDHHIRCGNSLIGAKIENLSNLPELRRSRRNTSETQTEILMEFPFTDKVARAIGHYLLIEEMESRTADQIHAMEHQLDIAQQMLRFHKGVANLWTSVYFGNDVSRATYHQALNALRSQDTDALENLLSYRRAQGIGTEKKFFHWEIEFPEVFRDKHGREKDNPGFDAVVGNPPYANAWGMTSVDPQDRSAIKQLCNISDLLKGHWDLYAPFIIKSLELLCERGYHAFIVPDALAREKYADRLREFLLKNAQLLTLLHFEGVNVFEEVSRHCFIYTLMLENPDPQLETKLYAPDVTVGKEKQIGQIQQTEWFSSENYQIRFQLADPTIRSIGNKVWANSIRLGQFCYVMLGSTTHSKDRGSFTKADIVSKQEIGNAKRFIDGKNLQRYDINWDERYIDYRQDEMYGPRVPELFESEKIVVRNLTGANEQVIISYDNSGFYCDDLVVCVTYYENLEHTTAQIDFKGYDRIALPYSLTYATALLGSSLLTWLFRVYFATGTLQGSYSHTYPQQVRAMPIRRINFTTAADERDRQLEKAKRLYQRCLDRGSIDCVIGFVMHHLTADPERSDIVHDLLAFLAEGMVEMNKAKGEEIRGFLSWLEREIGVEIDTLKNKTAIQGYFDLSFERLLEILRRNRRSITIDLSSRGFQESLEREFTNSLAKLDPLRSRIQSTDELIDQVVYQLYSLTDEEIAIVEGDVSQS